jgi:hypothetical protein
MPKKKASNGAIRDALLPKLLLGKIRIEDAERFVGRNA